MTISKEAALLKLHPNLEFNWKGEDLSGLTILTEGVSKPTEAQLNKAKAELEIEATQAEAKRLADKANALAKLAGLGLTEDEAKAVIGI